MPHHHRKVIHRIIACRTAALGGHVRWCDQCGFEAYVYHSCRDRHCPKCQTHATEQWRQARQLELLPVPYFHQVFTLPHELNAWLLANVSNQRALLGLLFEAASDTLLEFGRRTLGGEVGFTLVLHTWDQLLRPHFHLHGLIAAGALSRDGKRWIAGGRKFLFPVRGLSKMFRGKFLAGFAALLDRGELAVPPDLGPGIKNMRCLLRQLRRKAWVVYSKPPFAGPAKLLDYLSRYTHRVAISNDRLVGCADGEVEFRYRDRRDGDRRKHTKLPVDTFLKRFLCHVLPERFMRIRHYGFLANRYRREKLGRIRCLLGVPPRERLETPATVEWLAALLGIDLARCPCCGGPLSQREIPRDETYWHGPAAKQPARAPPRKGAV
jgi:hypothetical protein